jgi:hypothetical protein
MLHEQTKSCQKFREENQRKTVLRLQARMQPGLHLRPMLLSVLIVTLRVDDYCLIIDRLLDRLWTDYGPIIGLIIGRFFINNRSIIGL